MLQVLTANRLIDGEVVYLATDGAWVERLAAAKGCTAARPQSRAARIRTALAALFLAECIKRNNLCLVCGLVGLVGGLFLAPCCG